MVKKIILKVIVFLLVATGSAFVVDKINNINKNKVSRELEQSTMPTVYFYLDNKIVNSVRGYTQVMSTSLMRDSVIPLSDERSVQVLVDERQGDTNTYSYELRSIAGDNLIEKGDIDRGELTLDGYRKLVINFRMDMKENQEYTLVFIVNSKGVTASEQDADNPVAEDDTKIRYYTRVANLSEHYAAAMIDFAYDFHDTTFVKTVSEEEGNLVYDRIHPKAEDVDDDLSHVSLNSSYDMITWGGMDIIALTSLIPTIVEIDDEFALIKFSYIAENYVPGNEHYFNVDEYYSMKYDKNNGQVKLLTFDRYQSSFFDASYISRSDNSIGVGITDKEDFRYVASADNQKIAFVKEGELWLYDYTTATLTTVFSYVQGNYTNTSANNQSYNINIDNIDEDGNLYFTVYGYISRGEHEGENGISLYHFTIEDSKIEEKFFISCNEPYDVMKEEIGRFTYFDGVGNYYYLLDGCIYSINLEDMNVTRITEPITSGKYVVSENRHIVAYPNSDDEQNVTEILIHNFETNSDYTRTAASGNRLLALGFVENDLIYGEANASDILVSSDGKVTLPLTSLYIIQPTGEPIKEYNKSGIYIMNSVVQADKIYLKRAIRRNNFFVETEPDFISYKHTEDDYSIALEYIFDEAERNCLNIVLPANMYLSGNALPVMTKHKNSENYKEMKLDTVVMPDRYYVFDNLGYKAEYTTAGQAIEQVVGYGDGLVVDGSGNTIYRNQDAVAYNTVADSIDEHGCENKEDSLMTCAYMCIEYTDSRITYEQVMAYSDFKTAFSELTTGIGINISGIELSTALYFLDRDIPFVARIDDGRYVLVISYNSTHIRYYDPIEDAEFKVTRDNFEDMISQYGNTMYTFSR